MRQRGNKAGDVMSMVSVKKALLLSLVVGGAVQVILTAQSVSVGRNNNLNPGIADQFVGDPLLQRQVESKGACSPLNLQHCVFGANDYRTVIRADDLGTAEGIALGSATPPPDAWIGLYRCYNGPEGACANGLLPGFPTDSTALGHSQPWYGLAAGSDLAIAADPNGYFPSAALIFNRGGTSQVVFWTLRDFNDDSKQPIRWPKDAQGNPYIGKVLDQGSATANGAFADLPAIAVDVFRGQSAAASSTLQCGDWHVAWTVFANKNSSIWYTVSHDCGQTFENKVKISNPISNSVQRVVLDVGKGPNDGGTVYATFRTFNPDGFAFTKKPRGGNWTAPVYLSNLSAPAGWCSYDQASRDTSVNDPDLETARALGFATFQALTDGRLVAAFTERSDAAGNPLRNGNCPANVSAPGVGYASPARPVIQVTYSDDGGLTWKPRQAIDIAPRCEAQINFPNNPDGPVERPCDGSLGPVNQRNAGPQLQPILRATPHLFLSYREGRGGIGPEGFHSGRNAQMDQRVARLGFDANGIELLATTQVSQYALSIATGDIKDVDGARPGQKAYNRPYIPQYKSGTAGFMGDHDDFVAFDPYVFESPARWATPADVPQARGTAVWGGDTRNAGFPDGNVLLNLIPAAAFTLYSPPTPWGNCVNPSIRNSDSFAAYVGDPIDAYAPQPFRPMGGDFSGGGSWAAAKKRTWPIVIRNRSDVTRAFIATVQANSGFTASWDEFNLVPVLGNKPSDNPTCGGTPPAPFEAYPACTSVRVLLPRSSMTLTVFGTGPADGTGSPIKVLLDDLATPAGTDVIVRLNPNPNNPPPVTSVASGETHGASISGPFVQATQPAPWKGNPGPGNPGPGNPGPGNPGPGNSTLNPGPGNPGPGNTGFTDYTDVQYLVKTEDLTNVVSAYSAYVNISNPDSQDSHFVQMIISRTLTTPSACVGSSSPAGEKPVDEIVSIIPVPGPGNPGPGNPGPGNPGPGNPGPGNPGPGNPGPGNPGPGNNTFALAPSAAPASTVASASFRATAVASASSAVVTDQSLDIGADGTIVSNVPPDEVLITVRYWHCTDLQHGCTAPDGRHFNGETDEPGGALDPVNNNTVGGTTAANAVAQANNTNVLNDGPYVVNEDVTLSVGDPNLSAVQGVLLNDSPGHGGTLTASLVSGPGYGPFNGTTTVSSNGSFAYTPASNFNGTDTFIYMATESAGTATSPSTALARVTITVNPVNDAPVINPHANVGPVEATSAAGAVVNYEPPATHDAEDGDGFASCGPVSGATFPLGHTQVTCSASDTMGKPAVDSFFDVFVRDATAPTIDAHVNVGPVEATGAAGAAVDYTPLPATHDAVGGNGTATCLPASGSTFALGHTQVTCKATDAASNHAADSFFDVFVRDTTPPALTVPANITTAITSPSGAVVNFTAPSATDVVDTSVNLVCTSSPTAGLTSGSTFPFGTTTESCVATDDFNNTANKSFTITVDDTTPPVASNQSVTTNEDTGKPITLVATDVRALTYSIVTGPSHGTLSGTAPNVTYTATANYNGSDSFTFKANDGGLNSNVATVSITVNAVNDAPSFVKGANQTANANSGLHTVSGWATGISKGPSDESGQTVNFIVTNDNNALFSVQPAVGPTGTLTYTPAASAKGVATVTVKLHDNGGTANGGVDTSAAQTFTITVNLVYGFINVQNLPPPSGTTFTRGALIPLKWRLAVGLDLDADDVVNSSNALPQITITWPNGTQQTFTQAAPGSGNSFQAPTAANGNTWTFNLQTGSTWPIGAYSVRVTSLLSGQTFGPFTEPLK